MIKINFISSLSYYCLTNKLTILSMKNTIKLFIYCLAAFLIFGGTAYASFPVKNESKKEQSIGFGREKLGAPQIQSNVVLNENDKEDTPKSIQFEDIDEKLILVLLLICLWPIAAHRWYKRKPIIWNILFILTIGGYGIWLLIDLVNILIDEF